MRRRPNFTPSSAPHLTPLIDADRPHRATHSPHLFDEGGGGGVKVGNRFVKKFITWKKTVDRGVKFESWRLFRVRCTLKVIEHLRVDDGVSRRKTVFFYLFEKAAGKRNGTKSRSRALVLCWCVCVSAFLNRDFFSFPFVCASFRH